MLGRAGAVHRNDLDGTLDGTVELPTTNPTSVAFGGTDRRDGYITTPWLDCEERHRGTEPLPGVIFRCYPGVTRRPSPRWAGDAWLPHDRRAKTNRRKSCHR